MPRLGAGTGTGAGPSKRKANGPVPAAATTKPPAKRARKTFVLDGSDGDGSAITLTSDESRGAKGRVMRGREKSGKRARPDDDDDDEEEGDGMTDTQQLLAIVNFGSKEKRETAREAREYASALQRKMEKRHERVRAFVEERKRDEEIRDANFLTSFREAYTLASPVESHTTLRQSSKTLIASARALIESFENAAARVAALDTSDLTSRSDAWIEEDKALAKILAAGKRVAAHKHQMVLDAEGKKGVKTRFNAEEVRAERVFYDGEEGRKGGSVWGEVARRGEKALRRLARAVERH